MGGPFFFGGPMTRYAMASGENNWSGGERIMPVTMQDAREWAETHLATDKYESIFGAVVDDETKTTVCWQLPSALIERVRRIAQERGATQASIAAELIEIGAKSFV